MDERRNDGGPAYPVTGQGASGVRVHSTGMSLRDWFAGQAMARLLDTCRGDNCGIEFVDYVASHSYRIADAMLKARK